MCPTATVPVCNQLKEVGFPHWILKFEDPDSSENFIGFGALIELASGKFDLLCPLFSAAY
jgi:hypothetical protein